MSVTLWDNLADAHAYESSDRYRELVEQGAPYFASAPSLATYDVPAHS